MSVVRLDAWERESNKDDWPRKGAKIAKGNSERLKSMLRFTCVFFAFFAPFAAKTLFFGISTYQIVEA